MTNETAPERIWVSNLPYDIGRIGDLEAMGFAWNMAHGHNPVAYIREDISEIRTERVRAELEAAQARIAELEGALRPFVAFQHRDHFDGHGSFDLQAAVKAHCKLKRIARAALEGKG